MYRCWSVFKEIVRNVTPAQGQMGWLLLCFASILLMALINAPLALSLAALLALWLSHLHRPPRPVWLGHAGFNFEWKLRFNQAGSGAPTPVEVILKSSVKKRTSDSVGTRTIRLHRKNKENQQRKEALSRQVASDSSLKAVQEACQAILNQPSLKAMFRFDVAKICLWNNKSLTLQTILQLPQPINETASPTEYKYNEGYTGWIAAHQRSLLIPDTTQRADITPKAGLANYNYGSFLGVPLKVDGRFLGTLELLAKNKHIFDQQSVTLLEVVANQVAVALENAQLYNVANQQLQRRIDELAGLQRVSNELNSTLDMNKILSMVLDEALQLTRADSGDVFFYNAAQAKLIAYPGNSTASRQDGIPREVPATEGIIGRSLSSGQSMLILDTSQDPDFVDRGGQVRSKVVVPIIYGGEPTGVINLESQTPDFFNDNQMRYLEALANHAAVAIGNALAYQQQIAEREQASRRADQLSRLSEISNAFRTNRPLVEVLEDVAFAISESVGYDVVLLSLVRGKPAKIFPQVGAGIPLAQLKELKEAAQAKPLANLKSVMRKEFKVSKSYFIPAEHRGVWQGKLNVPYIEKSQVATQYQRPSELLALAGTISQKERWQSGDLLLVPLTDTEGNITGLLTVANPIDDQRPDHQAVRTLETFANHAAAAIENAQLFELEQQRRRLANTLRGVAEAISSQLEFDELLNIILQELGRVVNYGRANVQLLQEDRLVIIGARGWADSQQVIGQAFSMSGNNPNRRVIEIQEPVIINDTHQEYAEFFQSELHPNTRSWLGVPLTYGTNILGIMVVDKDRPNFFTQEDVDVILAFANQVAVALQNARLFDEARQQVRQLAALTEVAQSLNQALDLNEVLNLVLDAVFDLVGQQNGSIWLIDFITNTIKMADTKNIPSFLVELFNESEIPTSSEPFVSVIKSGEVLIVQGDIPRDVVTNFGMPFPNDVTYVPLKTDEGVIGIFAIEAVIHNRNMLKLVTTLADLAAVAIESARLLEDTRRRATEMQNLYNLGVEVSRMLDVRQVMSSVVSNSLKLSSCQLGAVMFLDEQTNQYVIENAAATAELTTKFGLDTVNLADSHQIRENVKLLWTQLAQEITTKQKPVTLILPALGEGKTGPLGSQAAKLGIRAILGVPIYVQNEIDGAIFVASLDPRHFDSRDVQTLSFVANQASVSVRNAQLVQRLNLLTEELEQRVAQRTEELAKTLQDLTEERDRVGTLYQVARELSTSFDLDRVLNEALNLLNRAIGISHGSILLLDRESEHLVYRAALGRYKPLPRGGIQTPYKVGYGLAGKVMEYRSPRLIADLSKDPDWLPDEDAENDERRSAIAVPLSTGDDVLGTMLLFHPEPNYFSQDQLKLVSAASAQIATAVNNAELYRLITDQAKRLGTLYRQQAAEAAKNQAILEGITDGVLVLDADHRLVLVNPKAAEILNVNAANVENQPLRQILGRSESPVELELTQLLYENLLVALEEIAAGKGAAQFRIEAGPKVVAVSLAPVSLGTEDRPSIVAVLRDISKEAEVERLKNEFISTVSHELRTPMTSIKGYSDLLLSGNARVGTLNETQNRFVKVIQSNANRLTELVNDILEISRIETGRIKLAFTSFDLISTIREVAISFEGQLVKKKMNLSLNLPDELPNVYADKARLTQVLVNLIGNAWQYTPEGGDINVFAKRIDNFIQIDVADTGIGIVEKDVAYIFDRFFRSERHEVQVVDGTGLGLSITKSFVEMLGGQIWVKSQIDVGTTFSFTVPIDMGQEGAFPMLHLPILLIYGDEEVADYLKSGLESNGCRVMVAKDTQEALDLAQNSGKTIRAIILDVALQEMNSFALLEQLKNDAVTANIPVLLALMQPSLKGARLQIVDSITPDTEAQQVVSVAKQVLNSDSPPRQTQSLGARPPVPRILVIDQDRTTADWLRDILSTSGYEVHCAFNSRQGLDMVFGYLPELIFLNTSMPDVDNESLISQLHRDELTSNIPVVLVTKEQAIAPKNGVKIWGKDHWAKNKPFVPVHDLAEEIAQLKMEAAGGQKDNP